MARTLTPVRLDRTDVELARVRAGLPEDVGIGAIVRYALATLAGTSTETALDERSVNVRYQRRSAA